MWLGGRVKGGGGGEGREGRVVGDRGAGEEDGDGG